MDNCMNMWNNPGLVRHDPGESGRCANWRLFIHQDIHVSQGDIHKFCLLSTGRWGEYFGPKAVL